MFRPFRTALGITLGVLALAGCGTTRSTDSMRTATEQLLISDAIDRAVQTIDFAPLRGQTVYLDDSKLEDVVDKNYLVSTLRQHILASGCTLKNNRNEADFIVEARAGAVGTDRNDLLFGIPATNVPQIVPLQGVPAAIPEVPLAKRLDQRGVAKISMFAYHRESGRPVWQSGLASRESSSNDVWLFGAGPFQYGSVLHQHPEAHVVAQRRSHDRTRCRAAPQWRESQTCRSRSSSPRQRNSPSITGDCPPRIRWQQRTARPKPSQRPSSPTRRSRLHRRLPRNQWSRTRRFPSQRKSTLPAAPSRV